MVSQNPTRNLDTPNLGESLPFFLGEEDMAKLLAAASTAARESNRSATLRFWAALEMLYAAGLRVSELVTLKVGDLDFELGLVHVRGKGGFERLIPFGKKAQMAIRLYMARLGPAAKESFIFSARGGRPWSRFSFYALLKKWTRRVLPDLPFSASPHKIRHSFATHLLNRGADLKSIQELLGHRKLSTTQIYTHLDMSRLKMLHKKFHPRG